MGLVASASAWGGSEDLLLTTAEAERYGAMSLREHYENVAKNGQEYDPYTTVFAKNPLIK